MERSMGSKQLSMNVSLPETLKQFVDDEVRERGYTSASEFIRELIRDARTAREQDRLDQQLREAFANEPGDVESIRQAISELRSLRHGTTLGSATSIRQLIDEGRT